ncbi:MAG TPA: hypothetical protein VGO52_07035 [Hyphomonadaceae bacterium]|nr:hypothetical protein [Hyphomonadaceae bacterium]
MRSIWALEVLLLLRRRAPAGLTADEIVAALRASPGLITRIIDQLVAERLVIKDAAGAIRFECDPGLAKLCDALELAAQDRPIALRDAIHSSPNDKLRNFSDAFRLKGKEKDREGDDR